MSGSQVRCHWCGDVLVFAGERGYVHREGGVYVVRCADCGWSGAPHPSPAQCPRCNSREIWDDHAAMPWSSEAR